MISGEQQPLFVPAARPVPGYGDDPGLDRVEAELYRLDPDGSGVAGVLRDTLDQLYDGQHTGRWDFGQLHKTGPKKGECNLSDSAAPVAQFSGSITGAGKVSF